MNFLRKIKITKNTLGPHRLPPQPSSFVGCWMITAFRIRIARFRIVFVDSEPEDACAKMGVVEVKMENLVF